MKRLIFILFISISIAGCGVSSKDKEKMQNSLTVRICDAYMKESSYTAMFVNAELKSVEEEPFVGLSDGYKGVFSCTFKDGDNNVHISGSVGFDKYGFLANLPNYDDRLAVNISTVVVNGEVVTDLSKCKYVLPCFTNSIYK